MLPYGRQQIDEDDIQAVLDVLHSDRITQGPAVERFEQDLADYCGSKYAVAVSSGTAALHVAFLAADVGPGDVVASSPITFLASLNAALLAGAAPALVDIEAADRNISVAKLEALLRQRKVKAIVPVHFAGLPCDVEEIADLARRYGATVIEDAAHALSAEYTTSLGQSVRVGSCRHSDMTCFSFHPVKPITTGEGGAVTTNDPQLYERLRLFRTHGISRDPANFRAGENSPWYYEMHDLGLNYRITDLQCALGSSQLKKLDGWRARREQIARAYDYAFRNTNNVRIVEPPSGRVSAHHLYVIEVEERERVFQGLLDLGIGPQVHYIPINLQPYYQENHGCRAGDMPVAERYYSRAISLPLFPGMTDSDVNRVITAILDLTGHR